MHQLTISTSYIDRIKKNCVHNNLKTRRRATLVGYCPMPLRINTLVACNDAHLFWLLHLWVRWVSADIGCALPGLAPTCRMGPGLLI